MKRVLIFFWLFIVGALTANAISTDAYTEGYWPLIQNVTDILGLQGNITGSGFTITTDGANFTGSSSYADLPIPLDTSNFTINFNLSNIQTSGYAFVSSGKVGLFLPNTTHIQIYADTGSGFSLQDTEPIHSANVLAITRAGNDHRFYLNGTEYHNINHNLDWTSDLTLMARISGAANSIDADLSYLSLWNRTLNSSEITDLYTNGLVIPGDTPTIEYNVTDNDYLNYQPTIFLNTTSIVNMSVVFNGAAEASICNNCDEANYTPTLVEGQNNFTFIANDADGEANSTLTLFYDTTNPTITDNLPTEINSYFLDFLNSTCNDTYLDYCNLTIQSTEYDLLTTNDTTLVFNGNWSYNITARDLAGNTNVSSGVILVNPVISFSFNDSGSFVDNYTFGGRNSSGTLVNYSIYNDGLVLGNNTLLFTKQGYVSQNFTFLINTTTNVNYTFNVTPAQININIYDRITGSLITENVSLVLIGDVGNTTSTTTGTATLRVIDGVAGEYQIIATTALYETESRYFTYDNQQNLTVDIYMLNSTDDDLGFVNVQVKDTLSFLVEGATVDLLEWKPALSAYLSVAQCQTASNGLCALNVELNNKQYKFQATKSSSTKITNGQIIDTNGVTIPITLEDIVLTSTPDLENTDYSVNETITGNTSVVRLQWINSDGVTSLACINTYNDLGFSQVLLSSNCTSASSGILFETNEINNTFKMVIKATIQKGANTYLLGTFTHESTASLATSFADNNLDILLPIIFLLIAVGIGVFFGNLYIGLSLIVVLEWIAVILAPSVMTASIASIITVFVGLTVWGMSRK